MKTDARRWTVTHTALAGLLVAALPHSAGADVIFDTFNADGSLPDPAGALAHVGWQPTYPYGPNYGDVPGVSTCVPVIQLFSINEAITLSRITFVTEQAGYSSGGAPTLSGSAGLYKRQDNYEYGPATFTPVGVSTIFDYGHEPTTQSLTPAAPITLTPGVYAVIVSGRNFAPSFLSEYEALPAFVYQQTRAAVGITGDDLSIPYPVAARTNSTGNRLLTLTAATTAPTGGSPAIGSTLRYPDGSVVADYIDHSQTLTLPTYDLSVPWAWPPAANGPLVMRVEGTPTGARHPQQLPDGNLIDDLDGVTHLANGADGTNPLFLPQSWRGTNFVQRTASFTATATRTRITFAFATDESAMALTGVSVKLQGNPSAPNLIANGNFAADSTTNRSVMIPDYLYFTGETWADGGETIAPIIVQPAGWSYNPAVNPFGPDQEQMMNAMLDQQYPQGVNIAGFLDDLSPFEAVRWFDPESGTYIYPRARELRLITGVTSDGAEPGENAFSVTSFGGYSTLSQVIPTVAGQIYDITYSYRVTLNAILSSLSTGHIIFSHDLNLMFPDLYYGNYGIMNLAVYAEEAIMRSPLPPQKVSWP
jgi:hypothetical protein